MKRERKPIVPGEKYGELTAVRRLPKTETETTRWLCLCSCGNEKIVVQFRNSPVISCGCVTPTGRKYDRSGLSNTPLYWVWHQLVERCNNPKNPAFKHYGARGISVCERWLHFSNFVKDMGERPEGLEIDRMDNDGNYEPGNCRWATRKEQLENKRGGRDPITGRFTGV